MQIKIDTELLRSKGHAAAYYDEDSRMLYLGRGTWIWVHMHTRNLDGFEDELVYFIRILNHEVMHHILNIHFGKDVSKLYDRMAFEHDLIKHEGL